MASKSSKKRDRQLAVSRENKRRQNQALESSPLSREQLDSLWYDVASYIAANGHQGDFSQTQSFLRRVNADIDSCIAFLTSNGMGSDFDVLMHCDPNVLFGSADGRHHRMPLSVGQLNDLLHFLDTEISKFGCDHSTNISAKWLKQHDFPEANTLMACLALGGGCDCEILLNVEPENIYNA